MAVYFWGGGGGWGRASEPRLPCKLRLLEASLSFSIPGNHKKCGGFEIFFAFSFFSFSPLLLFLSFPGEGD